MGVVYIGDREVGKTALALELIKPDSQYVKVSNQDYEKIKVNLIRVATGELLPTKINPTTVYENRNLKVEVNLPAGNNSISVDWIDTPGEIWQSSWQRDIDNAKKWGQVVSTVQQSEGVMLILPPYREMPGLKSDVDIQKFPTQQQWCNRFSRWVEFFRHDCRRVRHIVLCLNKADLFCDLDQEAYELSYKQYGSRKNWFQRNAYVSQKYFQPIQSQITEITKKTSGVPVRCFITSIYNRSLLELPWIYLASHLAS